MKMKNSFLSLFLGFFAAVHSTPVTTETQIPVKHEGDIFQEMESDGFLINHPVHTSTTPSPTTMKQSAMDRLFSSPETESHKIFEIIQTSENEEGSGGNEDSLFVSRNPTLGSSTATSTTTQTSENEEGSGGNEESLFVSHTSSPASSTTTSTTIQTSENEEGSGGNEESLFVSHTSTLGSSTATSTTIQTSENEEGSGGNEESLFVSLTPSPTSTTTSTTIQPFEDKDTSAGLTSNIRKSRIHFSFKDISETFHEKQEEQEFHKGHSTPDWIIIVGFLVGLASLVAVCAAIATREKWNGPKEISQLSDQKRELEMQTFLHKDEPKENGKDAEYTVIPLDELSNGYSSDQD